MSDYEKLRALPLEIDGYDLERREVGVSSDFTRVTTTVVLHGRGQAGRGEDVTYTATDHDGYPHDLPLAMSSTLDELSRRLDDLPLFPREPEQDAYHDYRRWAFESAALDLALRQRDLSLGAAVGREYRPVRFVVSSREIEPWLRLYPELEVKLDPTSEWTREAMERLRALAHVRILDLKGYYEGTVVDQPPDPRLYRDVVDVFPDAVVEDAALTDETRPILVPVADRLSFDAPIHSVADVEALEVRPSYLNVKPSRFGTLERLFEAFAYCEMNGIAAYGGGQFELGVGRAQIQALASLYHPDAPNDVAPGEYNARPRPGLPPSPLPAPRVRAGLAAT